MKNLISLNPFSKSSIKTRIAGTSCALGILLLILFADLAAAGPLPYFYDPNLQACFDEQAAAHQWVSAEDVRELVCVERGIRNFYGVEQLIALERLDLSGNRIDDLFPLGYMGWPALPNLVSLRLADNAIADVYPLEGYSRLETLWLSGNRGIDFQQLGPIIKQNPQLTRLGLGDIDLQEPGLPWLNIDTAAIVELDISNTGIEGLWGIQAYASLQVLDAADNRIADVYPLYMTPWFDSLRELNLANNRIVDVMPLQSYTELRTLWLSGNPGIDFQQLRPIIEQNLSLTRLGLGDIDLQQPDLPWFNPAVQAIVELDVSNTGLEGLWGIESYPSLQILDASDNQIIEIYPLSISSWFGGLKEVNLANNRIVDVMPLQNYTELRTLWLSGNPGIDFQQLRPIIEQNPHLARLGLGDIDLQEPGLPWFNNNPVELRELDLRNTGIEGLWGIEGYLSLQSFDASENAIFELYPLEMLSWYGNLRELNLANNRIVDVVPLQNLRDLRTLWMSGNSGIDFQQLRPLIEQNQQLTRLGLGGIDLQEPGLPWLNIDTYGVVELDLSHTGIEGLWGIESYKSLQSLDASDNDIHDLHPLEMLAWSGRLRELNLANNRIVDLFPLQGYTDLRSLWLSGNGDIEYQQLRPIIEQNQHLTRLGLGGIDLQELAVPWLNIDREGIVELDLSDTGIEWLWGIEFYPGLQRLDVSGNGIFELNPLDMLAWSGRLRELNLAHNQISDVFPLQGFTGLRTLWLSGNQDIDFQQLRPIIDQNPNLIRLGLGDIDLQEPGLPWFNIDIESVIELDLGNTGIEGLWGIEGYRSLQLLDVSANRLFDVMPLFSVPKLELVDLRENSGIPCWQLDQLEWMLGVDALLRPATCLP